MEKDEGSETHNEPAKLNMWAASLVAHRNTEDGYQFGHSAELIKAESEDEAREIGLTLARKEFPEDIWTEHSVGSCSD